MKQTVLLTGARAPATLDLARALARAGHRVIAAESLAYPLSIHSNAFSGFYPVTAPNNSLVKFKTDLQAIIARENVSLLIPTCEEAFHISKIKTELACEVLVDDFEKLNQLHSKFEFNQLCLRNDLDAPESYRVRSVSEAKAVIDRLDWKMFVLKPEYSRFASNTRIQDRTETLALLPHLSLATGIAWVIQNCAVGPEYCTYSLVRDGVLLAHVTYEHDFTAGRGAGICFRSLRHQKIENWVKAFAQKTKFNGQFAFDFIELNDGRVLPLECNPRATSGLHLVAPEPQFIHALLGSDLTTLVRPTAAAEGQLRLAMLIYGLPSVRTFAQLKNWFQIFSKAREVVFSTRDLLPFFDQFVTFYKLVTESRRRNISPLEVSTLDIEWNGGKQP